ncbi:pyridoxamine 5'-phosphate oxidase [Lacisediminimonas sp.]|uniref:pyridoxamine 5'-phosphate oxidase n=1 Tax=Lacisediminimonas sp. TaxID=3060582 RepID=UPI002719BA44|nr:pyridoxamine 5'-phosphate oxidase [Lacisediminimonas sp.]MDO8299277.1 pyridoxamine 5'-phosphate oxidase [Lacisediminimonas sp.]
MSIAELRREYTRASLSEEQVADDPVAQFAKWFDEALRSEVPEPNAMSVSTVAAGGLPSSRILLLKDFDQRGFTWYTNYESRKGEELQHNPRAALLFFWQPLERQVRLEGSVERVSAEEADAYFNIRPLGSRLGALASAQSRPIQSRQALEERYRQAEQQHGDSPQRPPHWGGYRLRPEYAEFWQGRASRLHDRIAYSLQGDGSWRRERLQP